MNNAFKYFAGILTASLIAAACQKTDKKPIIGTGTFITPGGFTVSSTSPNLAFITKNDTAVTFNWGPATFSESVVITYVVEIDLPSDTAGGAWKNAKQFSAGVNVFNLSIVEGDLNTAAVGLGLTPGTTGTLVTRVAALVNQSTGAESSVTPAYSNVIAITVTPYSLNLYIPNSAQNWSFTNVPVLNVVPDSSGKYEGYVWLSSSTSPEYFKYTNEPDFLHVNYGDSTATLLTTNGNAPAMSVATGGYYEVTADLQTPPGTWSATRTTWGVIGDATANGWTTDNEMTYDSVRQVWYIDSLTFSTSGSFKFRANDAWSIDFGIIAGSSTWNATTGMLSGPLVYVDNPFFAYNNQANLAVVVNGVYNVTLDLHVSGNYTYSLQKL